jgi:hypothetical protein
VGLRAVTIAIFFAAALGVPGEAAADVGLHPTTKIIPVGGVLAGHGDGAGMAAYLVPAARGPRRYACRVNAICEPQINHVPAQPFVFVGRLARTKDPYAVQPFRFVVPRRVVPGLYRLYLYCRPCGGSLIQSGRQLNGETIRVTQRPLPRVVRMGRAPSRAQFRVSEPDGVVLRLQLSVPHGTHAVATGTIPGLAGVRISTSSANCHQQGARDVCEQPEEWCPMPAAAWVFSLRKLSGPSGQVRLDFVVGPPPP